MRNSIKLSWRQTDLLTKRLARKVRAAKFAPDCVIGITVGGLVPLALLSRELGSKNVASISARAYNKKRQGKLKVTALPRLNLRGKRVLLVDEIADRGTTLRHISKILKTRYKAKEVKTAVLVVNRANCTYWPDWHVLEVEKWVTFPWEE